MGLDMYLYRAAKGQSYEDMEKDQPEKFTPENYDQWTDKYQVGYWRKCWIIHIWFVHNVQNDEDECEPHLVPHDQLKHLYEICLKAKLVPSIVYSDFDIGNESEDEIQTELDITAKQLKPIVEDPEFHNWDFYYRSSW
jgi:hypothetical protein